MSLSKIALFAFGLATVLVLGFQHADAAPRHGYWLSSTNSFVAGQDQEEARFDPAKGYPQGY
jgi:hypothetical protein